MASQDYNQEASTLGGCACGRIKFRISKVPQSISYCYCSECAQVSGAGFIPFAHFPSANVTWSQSPEIWRSSKVAERGFCSECGSTLSMAYDGSPDEISIAIGSIKNQQRALCHIDSHIFVQDKAEWVKIPDDGRAKYDKHRPEYQKKFEEWKAKAQ